MVKGLSLPGMWTTRFRPPVPCLPPYFTLQQANKNALLDSHLGDMIKCLSIIFRPSPFFPILFLCLSLSIFNLFPFPLSNPSTPTSLNASLPFIFFIYSLPHFPPNSPFRSLDFFSAPFTSPSPALCTLSFLFPPPQPPVPYSLLPPLSLFAFAEVHSQFNLGYYPITNQW